MADNGDEAAAKRARRIAEFSKNNEEVEKRTPLTSKQIFTIGCHGNVHASALIGQNLSGIQKDHAMNEAFEYGKKWLVDYGKAKHAVRPAGGTISSHLMSSMTRVVAEFKVQVLLKMKPSHQELSSIGVEPDHLYKDDGLKLSHKDAVNIWRHVQGGNNLSVHLDLVSWSWKRVRTHAMKLTATARCRCPRSSSAAPKSTPARSSNCPTRTRSPSCSQR